MQQTIGELEGRIIAALERLARAMAALDEPAAGGAAAGAEAAVARLTAELEAERAGAAQLSERVEALRARQDATVAALERRIEKLMAQNDALGIDVQRLRKINIHLRELTRSLREAATAQLTDPALVNKALQGELEALRASRLAEINEMEAILAELDPIVRSPGGPGAEAEHARG